MKKIIASLFAISVLSTGANAQTNAAPVSGQKQRKKQKKYSFGPEIRLNMADMTLKASSNVQKTTMKPGLAAGGIVDVGLNNHFYLQPGLFYLMNGCNIPTPTSPLGSAYGPSRLFQPEYDRTPN